MQADGSREVKQDYSQEEGIAKQLHFATRAPMKLRFLRK
jgi:hypothetical protein